MGEGGAGGMDELLDEERKASLEQTEEIRLTVKRGQEYTDMLSMKQQDSGIDQESMLRQRMGRRRAESA